MRISGSKMADFMESILLGGVITILKNMSSSMGRMTTHILWKIKHVPNHQSDMNLWGSNGI